MKLEFLFYPIQLKHTFRIANYARNETPCVFIKLRYNGFTSFGEAALPPYLKVTPESCEKYFKAVNQLNYFNNLSLEVGEFDLSPIKENIGINTPALAAIETALFDLIGKIYNKPVWEIVGSDSEKMPVTSCTIGIDSEEILKLKIEEAKDFKVLKIKLGTKNDKNIIEIIRRNTDKPLYVDANQGWTDKNEAVDFIHWLKSQNVLMIEQPMSKSNLEGNAYITQNSPLPVIADESCQNLNDVYDLRGAFHGINIKLMKCGGINEAQKMIALARKQKMKVMMGCMTESSCAINAASALAPQCDFVDLDGAWLIANNPFELPQLEEGKILLKKESGFGLVPKPDSDIFFSL